MIYLFPTGENTLVKGVFSIHNSPVGLVMLFGDNKRNTFSGVFSCWDTPFFICKTKAKEDWKMADYKKMYFELFNTITDVIEQLKEVQQKAEAVYMNEQAEIISFESKD